MGEAIQPIIPITRPNRRFKGHVNTVMAVAVFPDGRRMVTSSVENTLRLWDLKDGVVLKKMEGHRGWVREVAVSGDGQLIASGDDNGEFIAWDAESGESLTQAIKGHSSWICSLDFSADSATLTTGSWDRKTKLWNTKPWQLQGDPIDCHAAVNCVRYSPSGCGELQVLAIATDKDIQIWNPRTRECTAKFKAAIDSAFNTSLAWTPDGTRLLSGGSASDPTIREWDTSTWKQAGDPWCGHTDAINVITVNSTGTLVASASDDKHVRLWRLSDRRTIAVFKHSKTVWCATFSADGKYVFSGGFHKKISEWAVPEHPLLEAVENSACKEFFRTTLDIGGTAFSSTFQPPGRAILNYYEDHLYPSKPPNHEQRFIVQDRKGKGKERRTNPLADNRKKKSEKVLWEEALLDSQKVIERDPSSYLGYQFRHAALHGAQRYDEAIEAFQIMLSRLDDVSDAQTQKLRQQFVTLSEAEGAIQKVIRAQMENAPPRLLDTTTGLLCDRNARTNTFDTSAEYKELVSLTMKHADHRMERIKETVARFFRCVMLSHRWEENEPVLHDIQDKVVHELDPVGGIVKLQSFCKIARDAGYRWAWMDTCCINQTNNVEVQESVNSMFVWYRHSALTIVYLSDVPPSSKTGALAKSAWNTRGWTVQEFLAPKVVLFYQQDWTPYLDDCSPNHKDSAAIMRELGDAIGIDARSLVNFRPGMRGAREKLQWVSMRITTLQEDIAYSLFGIFGVHLPVIYGEKKQNALGRLLQEVVAQSGDITCLDWVGKSSEFNSCLPDSITSYGAPPSTPPSPPEDEMQRSVSSLRNPRTVEPVLQLYTMLNHLSAPRFAHRRLHLPCFIFPVTEIRRRHKNMYLAVADGLNDLLITTEDKLIPFSPAMPSRRTFLLVRPWDRSLLELSGFEEDTQVMQDLSLPSLPENNIPIHSKSHSRFVHRLRKPFGAVFGSSGDTRGEKEQLDSESYSRALRLIVRLGQPFSAFLLAQQWGGEYKRLAADYNIIAQVKDISSLHNMIDVRTVEIL